MDFFKFKEAVGAFTKKLRGVEDRFQFRSDVLLEIRDKDGNLKHHSFQHNLRTSAGADFWNKQLFTTSPATAGLTFIALTTDATAPAAGDTTLASEETTNGLARAAATLSYTSPTPTTTLSHTWTYTGSTPKVIAKVGAFTAISAGTLGLETLLTSTGTVNANGDQIAVTWTVNW